MFCAADPANAPAASYLRAVLRAASTPAFIAKLSSSAPATPLAAAAITAFSAASLAAITAPRPITPAAPPVNIEGITEGIVSPTASTI